jgi:hypothetical protein
MPHRRCWARHRSWLDRFKHVNAGVVHGSVQVGSGMDDAMRRKPPKVGTMITVKWFEKSESGAPRFPTFVCVRHDK